jgi:tetratricopeptide (TPR) repeat protein
MVMRHLGWNALALGTLLTLSQGARAATPEVPSVLKVLPSDTTGMVLVNTEAQAWEKLGQFPLFGSDATVPSLVGEPFLAEATGGDRFPRDFMGKPKRPVSILNFHIDILPWLGDRTAYAMLPNGSFITVASVKDDSKTQAYLTRLQTSRASKPTLLTYNNAQIIAWPPRPIEVEKMPKGVVRSKNSERVSVTVTPSSTETVVALPGLGAPATKQPTPPMTPGFALAYLPGNKGHVIVAPTVDVLKNLLDRQKNTSFSQHPDLQKTIADPRFATALVVGFGDYQAIMASYKKALEGSPIQPFQLGGDLKKLEEAYGNMTGFLWSTDQGMQAEGTLALKPSLTPELLALLKSNDTKNNILDRIPAVTYGLVNSNNIALPMAKLLDSVNQDKQTKTFLDGARKFAQGFLGLDDRDILPWMDREYAMFAFPTDRGFFAKQFQTDMGLGILIQTSDRKRAEAGLQKIQDSIVKGLGKGVKVAPRTVNNTTFTSINTPDDKSLFAYSWVSEDTVLMVTGAETSDRIVPKPWKPLADSPAFKEAIAPLPKDNIGYFYLDGSATSALIFNSVMPKLFGPVEGDNAEMNDYRARAGSIRYIVGTTTVSQANMRSVGIMQLGRGVPSLITAKSLVEKHRQNDVLSIDADQGIADLSRAIAIDPNLGEAYFYRGRLRLKTFDYAGALSDLNQATTRNFKSPLFAESRAIAYYNLHDYDKAIVELKQAIDPKVPNTAFFEENLEDFLFDAQMQMGDYKGALGLADLQLEGDGIRAEALYKRCDAKVRLGDFKAALEDCEAGLMAVRSFNQDTEKEIAAQLKAKTITQEEADEKRSEQTTAIPSLPQRCYARAALGVATALQECEALIEADVEDAKAYEYLGLGRAALKQPGNAKQAYGQAIALYETLGNQVAVKRVEALVKLLPR